MKIEFIKPHTDAEGKNYLPGWVADWSQPDAERAIELGVARLAPEGAYPRKHAAPVFECATTSPLVLTGEFKETGEAISLEDLPEQVKKETRQKEGGFFKK